MTWFHSAEFHAMLVVLAGILSAAIAALIDAIHSGAIPVPANYAIFGTLAVAVLTYLGVLVRNWAERQRPAPVVPTP